MNHKKYNLNNIKYIYLLFTSILVTNIVCLYIHNEVLPLIYLLFTGLYYLLNCSISKDGYINYFSGINKLFFKSLFKLEFIWHWGAIIFLPAFFALYSLDFKLSLINLSIVTLLTYLIFLNNPKEK